MKRLIIMLLIVVLSFSFLSGCNDNEINQIDNQAVQSEILDEFLKITEVPRESGSEAAISAYLKNWAKENEFKVTRDRANNIIIEEPASVGYENAPVVILQSKMDMHYTSDPLIQFDPMVDPITVIKNDISYIAAGTNLGADSGIGMATALYVLKHAEKHGPLRVIFTADGENDFQGAQKLNSKYLDGDYLINLNWNAKNSVGVSSAGTVSYQMSRDITWTAPKNSFPVEISISGLNGGDAESDINEGGANAIKVIGETLAKAQGKGIFFELASFNGGLSSDTIPTAATAVIIINVSDVKKLKSVLNNAISDFKSTYGKVEENYSFTYHETEMPDKVVSFDDNGNIISLIYGMINGIQTMSETFGNMPESSSNIGVVSTHTGNFLAGITAGSNSAAALQYITEEHEAISTMSAMQYQAENKTPIWEYNSDNDLAASLQQISENIFGQELKPDAVHKELECSWLLEKNPKLQMVSIGAYVKNLNTPEETLILNSVAKPAEIILAFLQNTKEQPQMQKQE